ncbi:MAG: Zn-ribbon-containing protein [Acidobacteriia bacterium]|nr:Zn-ribbon-containing protein [Terriglobia bacterium]
MFIAEITFASSRSKTTNRESLRDVAEEYLACLLRNGQIYGEYLIAWSNAQLVCFTYLARPNSIQKQYHSKWGLTALKKVLEEFGENPGVQMIEENIPRSFSPWRRSSTLYLFTHALHVGSPVHCGDSGSAVPVYELPISDQDREELFSWAGLYGYLDNIWLESDVLEIPAYKQLVDPRSKVSDAGRKLCRRIEAATGKPTFYYLTRYWGRRIGEASRVCPLCGGKWHEANSREKGDRFYNFHFRCKRCRLVSRRADTDDDERRARYGEYRHHAT